MRQLEPYHESYKRLLFAPVIRDMRTMAIHLAWRSERLGLFEQAREIKRIDNHLLWLLGKAAKFDFIAQVANGNTLLVGEGNFSFALSLAERTQINPARLTVTAFETESNLSPNTRANARELRLMGATVLYGVDATNLTATLGTRRFDNIIFQFPHVGSREPIEGHNPNFILVRDFLISASSQLARDGKVLISAVDNPHYRGAFQFDDAADSAGFLPPQMYRFDPAAFPGYEHRMTHQSGSALDNHDEFSTWVFRLA